jgi:hypothetical protein
MTDEEMKRLEGIAKEAERRNLITGETFPAWSEFLALIERVRKAERRGAEEMREKAAKMAAEVPERMSIRHVAYRAACIDAEVLIKAIPLPGDAP